MKYNWQQKDWPEFRFEVAEIQGLLYEFAEKAGRVSGALSGLPDSMQTETIIELMVAEAVKTSEIEGEFISREDVRSSLMKHLGVGPVPEEVSDERAKGVAQLMLRVRDEYAAPLSDQMLFDWHQLLLGGVADPEKLSVGQWRSSDEPMQVVSGAYGKWKVHYEAPPSDRVPDEMARYISWFNDSAPDGPAAMQPAPVRSAIAHVYFESVHPFEDGNGRVGRALSEKVLSQGLGRPVVLSLSEAIERKRNDYYDALKRAQRSNDVTEWVHYFVSTIVEAQDRADEQVSFILAKTRFFDRHGDALSDRQKKVVVKMLEAGPDGFQGGMNARKYMSMAKVSKATATRDLQHLAEIGALLPVGAGRSARYEINLANEQLA